MSALELIKVLLPSDSVLLDINLTLLNTLNVFCIDYSINRVSVCVILSSLDSSAM